MGFLISALLSFLIPIVIVVSIVVRVSGVIKNLRDSQKNPLRAAGPSIQTKTEGLDDEDDWKPPELDDDDDVPVTAPVYRTPAPYAAGGSAYDLTPVPREPEAAPAAAPEFFRRLEARPIMQQAVILAEVLGPPKGME
jgi:hypothetical protein